MHEVVGLLLLLGLGLVLYALALVAYTAHALTHPPRRTYASALARNQPGSPGELDAPRAFEERTLRLLGHDIPLWDIPGDDPSGPPVVLTPGWGDSRIGALARLEPLLPRASRIIAWEPPGLGEARGTCALGTREVRLLLALLEAECPDEPPVLFGWSLGAGVSIAAAAGDPARAVAVIAEAPYRVPATPARAVLRARALPHRFNLPAALAAIGVRHGVGPGWSGFDRAALASRLACPLLVLHGTGDPVCPLADACAITTAAGAGATLVETLGARHNDLWIDPGFRARQVQGVDAFLAALPERPARVPTIPA